LHIFIFTTDQVLCGHELVERIMKCDHSMGLKECLNQLNLLYIYICLYLQHTKSYDTQGNRPQYGLRPLSES
jgi:hypothetical protein